MGERRGWRLGEWIIFLSSSKQSSPWPQGSTLHAEAPLRNSSPDDDSPPCLGKRNPGLPGKMFSSKLHGIDCLVTFCLKQKAKGIPPHQISLPGDPHQVLSPKV